MVTVGAGEVAQDANSLPFKPEELLRPSAFPHPVTRLEMRQTNISLVILTGSFAYKIKKNVKLEFIDTSTLALRRHLCEEELRLNRRLAADLYLDVVVITREAGAVRVGGHGDIIDYAVRMRQFETSQELLELLKRGEVSPPEFVALARRLGQFHADASRASTNTDYPHTTHLRDAVIGNLAILRSHLDPEAMLPELKFLADWTRDYLRDSLPQLRMREELGFIRECHGDLHARNVARWRGELVPFDCLEFDPKLRWIDVMNDVAFLVMDLTAYDRKDLAFAFLNAYLEHTGDYDGVRHLAFYAVYRALVRAMVDGLGAESEPARRQEFHDRLRIRVNTAVAFISRSTPTLMIMHGLSGSGKSWLSEQLIVQLGAVRIRSDIERKRLAGAQASATLDRGLKHGLYDPQFSRRTYARLLECAESCLNAGVNIIVDAAFLVGAERRLFRDLAVRKGLPFIIVLCEADRGVLVQRMKKREQLHLDPSEADVDVLNWQLQHTEPLSAEERSHVIAVDTTEPNACQKACAAIRSRLDH
jgi:aminoglycoside phosphotransferase family enzyme/predicted kinase